MLEGSGRLNLRRRYLVFPVESRGCEIRSHASVLGLILFFAIRCGAAPGCVPEELFDGLPRAPADLSQLLHKAEGGDPDAQFRAGLAYDTGVGVKRDYRQAADWYRKAANSGNPGAQSNLAGLYSRGLGVPQSDNEAFRWYMRAAAAGNAAAQNNLGFLYAEGRGVSRNDGTAVLWYRKAASQDYPGGETNLGFMYSVGRGVPLDAAQAMKWYHKAAKKDFALAEFELGQMYFHGTGVRQDFSEALGGFRKAAAHGSASAETEIGFAYSHGWGVKQDYAQAEKWYGMAAAGGSAAAQRNLAIVLARNQREPGDSLREASESLAGSSPTGSPNPDKSTLDGLPSGAFSLSAANGADSSAAGVPIELSRRFGLILVRAEVNDRTATLVIDTGCSHTILSTKLLQGQLLTLEPAANASKGSGWVGNANWIKATVKVGDTVWHDHKFLVMDDLPDISNSLGQKIDGILGEDVLQEFSRIQIDFSHRQLMLSH